MPNIQLTVHRTRRKVLIKLTLGPRTKKRAKISQGKKTKLDQIADIQKSQATFPFLHDWKWPSGLTSFEINCELVPEVSGDQVNIQVTLILTPGRALKKKQKLVRLYGRRLNNYQCWGIRHDTIFRIRIVHNVQCPNPAPIWIRIQPLKLGHWKKG
jgi:hypothetical protein